VAQRVAEHVVRGRFFGPRRLLRVDLHGVSSYGAGDERSVVRWEWVEAIEVEPGAGVVVRSASDRIALPPGAFGLSPEALAAELERARSITARPDVIGRLSGAAEAHG
jgi:hypothetical protein